MPSTACSRGCCALVLALMTTTPAAVVAGGWPPDHGDHPARPEAVAPPGGASRPSAGGQAATTSRDASGLDKAQLQALQVAPLPGSLKPQVSSQVEALLASPDLKQALAALKADEARFVRESIQISEIPAPTFAEAQRAKAFEKMLKANGLQNVHIDAIGNVIGVRKGGAQGPRIAVIAHLDTVFDAKTDVRVRAQGSRRMGPGLTDDSNALAMMLSWIRALNGARISTPGDLIFVASVGEEGNGDLRGAKHFFDKNTNLSAAIILEGALPDSVIMIQNTASNRFKIDFKAPGGHSYGAFGQIPSAIHAQGRFIAKVAEMQVPSSPRTTFTVGVVRGGRSVNTIAPDASLEIDLRSNGNSELEATTKMVQNFVAQAVAEENKRWGTTSLSASIRPIGARPGGITSPDQAIVHTWIAAARALGVTPLALAGGSTDAGVPISRGIPAIVMGCGGTSGGFHALDEHWDPTNAYRGVRLSFLTTLAVAGVQGVSEPTATLR
ncbi:MAG: M20/M25/M40 family metallo-hydrolase [Cyanobacteriota bacterium]